jgi:hypothetical protein
LTTNKKWTADRIFAVSLCASLLIRILAAWLFPLTGDEAYFVQWGRSLEGSYYDHGPITGWWLWAVLQLGEAPWVIRLPALLTSAVVPLLFWRIWRTYDAERASLGAALLTWSLPSMLSFLMTTDTPLLFFSSLTIAAAWRAHRTDRAVDYFLTGLLLGAAFLAKYFAVLLGLGLGVWWLALVKPRRWRAVFWLLLGVAPFAAQHVYWNYHHSWTNVMFNVLTRQANRSAPWYSPFVFVAVAAWLFGPAVSLLCRCSATEGLRRSWREGWTDLKGSRLGLLVTAFIVPYAVFFAVSFSKNVGVHWLLSFYSLGFVLIVVWFRNDGLRRLLRPMALFGAGHVALGLLVCLLPVEWAKGHSSYVSIVLGLHPDEVLKAVQPYRAGYHLATPSYAKSALLEFYAKQPTPVLGLGSAHGRQDDLRTDWRSYDGANFAVISHHGADLEKTRSWFADSEIREFTVRGATFHLLLGRGFRYPVYRDEVLAQVARRYYQMPQLLDTFSSGCFFKTRYALNPSGHAGPYASATRDSSESDYGQNVGGSH